MQTKIVHRFFPTNSLLQKMNLKPSNICSFCNKREETLLHLFYECEKVKPILQHLISMVREIDPLIQINSAKVLIGTCNSDYKVDTMLLNFKRYIVSCKSTTTHLYMRQTTLKRLSQRYGVSL